MTGKAKFIISDTHLGAGHYWEGNVLEDFISDEDFAHWIDTLIAESEADGVEMELIINGDFLELLQVPATDTFAPVEAYPPEAYAPTHEVAAVRKIHHVLAGHEPFFAALRRFISAARPRRSVTINKGNHDPELYWPLVQAALRGALAANGDRAELLRFPSIGVSREGIYVEHGNQYTENINRYTDFAEPLDPERPGELERVPGSRFVYEFFNGLERERPWIDGVSPLTALIWYAFAFDTAFALRALFTLLKAAPGLIAGELGIRGTAEATALLDELSNEDQQIRLAQELDEDPAFRDAFLRRVVQATSPLEPAVAEMLERRTPTSIDPFEVAQDIQHRYTEILAQEAGRIARETGAMVVSFGHTHRPVVRPLPNGGVYINSGTWVWRGDFAGADREVWRDLFEHPERYSEARELTYVRIDYDDNGTPRGELCTLPSAQRAPSQERRGCLGWIWGKR